MFDCYIVQFKDNPHWYEVKGIDYVLCKVLVMSNSTIVVKSFFDINKIKKTGQIKRID